MIRDLALRREHRVAIFWGGGLGDVLVLRPLLLALGSRVAAPPELFTTADHLPELLSDLGLRASLRVLPRRPREAIRLLRGTTSRYDVLYLGPYAGMRTRLLARAVRAETVWQRRHPDVAPFIGEQVLADVRAFGLDVPPEVRLPYGGAWIRAGDPLAARPDYLVLHPGAKARWETTRWPGESWIALMRLILEQSPFKLLLAGVEPERLQLESLMEGLSAEQRARVSLRVGLPLRELAQTVVRSAGVICHNSGVMHLAAMLGQRTVVLTGSSARYWRPPYAHVVNLTSGACELACNRYRCPVPFYRARCIRRLSVESAMHTVRERLLVPARV